MRGNPGRSRNHPINEKQELFCREFLVDHNGTQAAVRAGYSKPSAHSQASYLLRQPKIKRRIAELAAEQRERVTLRADLTLERLMNELSKIALADISGAVRMFKRKDGTQALELVPFEEMNPDLRCAIRKVWSGKDGVHIEMHDKRQALSDLGQHFGLRNGSKTQLAIGFNGSGSKGANTLDFSKVSNEKLAQMEAMLLSLEADSAAET